jgi:serine protease AprX
MVKVKVFCPKERQGEIENMMKIQASYDAFIIGEAPPEQLEELKQRFPTEDMSYIDSIDLKNQTIDTHKPRISKNREVLSHSAYTHTNSITPGLHYYIVQFIGPIKQEWLKDIKKNGAILREPFSNFSYIVEMDKTVLSKIVLLPYLNWVGHYDPKYRISSEVIQRAKPPLKLKDPKKAIARLDKTSATGARQKLSDAELSVTKVRLLPFKYSIDFFAAEDIPTAKTKLAKLGVKIVSVFPENKRIIIDIKNAKNDPANLLLKLPHIHGVKQIQEIKMQKTRNNIARGIMNANGLINDLGLTGKGEIIGVADTGLDSGDPSTLHPDFRGRIKKVKSYPIDTIHNNYVKNPDADDGAKDEDSGHGTHVAGSVLGDGASSVAAGHEVVRGLAYESELVFEAIEQWANWTDEYIAEYENMYGRRPEQYGLLGIPTDISKLFEYARRNGCNIHTNSWGGGEAGAYDQQCFDLDEYVYKNKDFVVLFAAGNSGVDQNEDGKVDLTSVDSPGTAKNCITVGASENQRSEFVNETYGGYQWWPTNYPSPPIKDDPMTDGSGTDVVAFSSRGPTNDGRIKPDVVAPGTFILSTRSRFIAPNHTGWAKFAPNKDYFFMGGTSMATPLVAGAIALIRQFLRTKKKIRMPSAALLKATLIHGAERMDCRYSAETRKGLYDMEQGWGLVNVQRSIDRTPAEIRYIDRKKGLKTGQAKSIMADVLSSEMPFKATLVWTDYPGQSLINNLNLIVTDPGGNRFNGNVFEPPFDSSLDISNNVESVFILDPVPGVYKIEVVGSNVAETTQDYALVYSGMFS